VLLRDVANKGVSLFAVPGNITSHNSFRTNCFDKRRRSKARAAMAGHRQCYRLRLQYNSCLHRVEIKQKGKLLNQLRLAPSGLYKRARNFQAPYNRFATAD